MSINTILAKKFKHAATEELTLKAFLELCQTDKLAYLSPAERLQEALGKTQLVDTSKDARLSRIFGNRVIKKYKVFDDFYGTEDSVEQIAAFVKHAAQGLEEKKQIMYLLGPVGGGKSSLVERIKEIMESLPFYAIKGSPIHENPLGLFSAEDSKELKIPARYLLGRVSPWALKRIAEFKGDISKFKVVKMYPDQANQIAISKTEPGDENNQDISSLVGKIDIRKLADFEQDDADAYSYSGGLCKGNRGIMEFVEMFKAPLKTLHPLLTATQEGNYNGTEAIPSIPFEGVIIAHSNESEWSDFRNNKTNEAFLDRIHVIKVPYCLRVDEEELIYKKLLKSSSLAKAVCAPQTLSILAKYSVLSRLKGQANSKLDVKMKVYNGENLKDTHPDAKSIYEFRNEGGVQEGFEGSSTRFAFKILSRTFNYDNEEVAANPVHLLHILQDRVQQEQYDESKEKQLFSIIDYLKTDYKKFLEREIKKAYLESYDEYGQNIFDRYVTYSEFYLKDDDYRDPDTGNMMDTEQLDSYLDEIETPTGISNKESFRSEIVSFCWQYRANNEGANPSWGAYAKMRNVIEKKIFANTDELLPVIAFSAKSSSKEQQKHEDFVKRMMKNGYTKKQVKLVVDWYQQMSKT